LRSTWNLGKRKSRLDLRCHQVLAVWSRKSNWRSNNNETRLPQHSR
jgi:hypothetical protein